MFTLEKLKNLEAQRRALLKNDVKPCAEYDKTFSESVEHGRVEGFCDLGKEVIPQLDLMQRFGYQRVGTGEKKDSSCGEFAGHVGCLREDLHKLITVDGKNHSGKVFIKNIYHSCDRPECPICYRRFAVREAGVAEEILKKASYGFTDKNDKKHMGFGQIEHIVDSCPKSEYELPFEKLKAQSLKAVRGRGFLGGFQIFHAERFSNPIEAQIKGIPSGWRYAPHFHYLGFLDGGYGVCRSCKKGKASHWVECWKCLGFEGVTRRLNVSDFHIVKVAADKYGRKLVRKTIFGTLFYQLNHATMVKGKVRVRVATWVGVCAYTKLKLKVGDRKKGGVCPICQHDLVQVSYVGVGEINNGQWWEEQFEDDYLDDRGVPKWIEIIKPNVVGGC